MRHFKGTICHNPLTVSPVGIEKNFYRGCLVSNGVVVRDLEQGGIGLGLNDIREPGSGIAVARIGTGGKDYGFEFRRGPDFKRRGDGTIIPEGTFRIGGCGTCSGGLDAFIFCVPSDSRVVSGRGCLAGATVAVTPEPSGLTIAVVPSVIAALVVTPLTREGVP